MGRDTLERIRREFQLRNKEWNYQKWDTQEWEEFRADARRISGIAWPDPLPIFDYKEWSVTQ